MQAKQEKRYRRHKRIRSKISGTSEVPRLCIFKSLNHIYAQIIDDSKGKTLFSANDKEITKRKIISGKEGQKQELSGKIVKAFLVGELIAKKATEKKIEKIVFDRGGYKYHGRIKALAEGAREKGLKF